MSTEGPITLRGQSKLSQPVLRPGKPSLVIFADGPRSPEEERAVEQTRAVIRAAEGFRTVRIVARTMNVGLFRNVVTGLTELFSAKDAVLVLEDDIEVGPDFLSYMTAALGHYALNQSVFSVTGYLYPAKFHFDANLDTFLFPRFCCWGWATWENRW